MTFSILQVLTNIYVQKPLVQLSSSQTSREIVCVSTEALRHEVSCPRTVVLPLGQVRLIPYDILEGFMLSKPCQSICVDP